MRNMHVQLNTVFQFSIEGSFSVAVSILANIIKDFEIFFDYSFRKPADLHNLAPGTHPPFITFQGEVRTDVNKIEEYLEAMLAPPK